MFTQEVINGQVVEVNQLKFKHILIASSASKEEPELITLYLLQQITKVNGYEVTIEFLKENEDFKLFNFLTECLTLQTKDIDFF